jgi:hypothetical protein
MIRFEIKSNIVKPVIDKRNIEENRSPLKYRVDKKKETRKDFDSEL